MASHQFNDSPRKPGDQPVLPTKTTKVFTEIDIEHLVIEDDTPVDNFQSEQQQRLLVEPLYSSEVIPQPFLAAANVGLFYEPKTDPIVPDMLLSLGIERPDDFSQKKNRCYIAEKMGKLPEVCIEIVSNREGDELTLSKKSQRKGKQVAKKDIYADIGISYYVVFDPLRQLQTQKDMNKALLRVWKLAEGRYTELTTSTGIREIGEWIWLEEVKLGLKLWLGSFEERRIRLWLRWCDVHGEVIPTGAESKRIERQQAEFERQRALFANQRAEQANQQVEQANQQVEQANQQVEQANQQVEQARQQVEMAEQRAEQVRQRAERLAEQLRLLGIEPEEFT
jgi:hypothetical protein